MRTLEEISIEVIQKCNSNCIYCSSFSEKTSDNEIPLSKLKELADFAISKSAKTMNISGGEPLLKEDLSDFIIYCTQLGLDCAVYTSGNVDMTEFLNKISSFADKIKFIFNYQSSNKEIFDTLVNCGEFSLNILNKNIENCIKMGFSTEAHIVPNALNLENIYETCLFLKDLGIKKVSLLRLVLQARAFENKERLYIKDISRLKSIVEQIESNLCNETFKLRVGIPFNNIAMKKMHCIAGYKKLIIRYDGIVFPCEAFKEAPNNSNYILGNIYNDNPEQIWAKYEYMHELHELKKQAQEGVETCPAQLLYL